MQIYTGNNLIRIMHRFVKRDFDHTEETEDHTEQLRKKENSPKSNKVLVLILRRGNNRTLTQTR